MKSKARSPKKNVKVNRSPKIKKPARQNTPNVLIQNSPVAKKKRLQHSLGGDVAIGLLKAGRIQADVKVGQSNDPLERQADDVAKYIVNTRPQRPNANHRGTDGGHDNPVQSLPRISRMGYANTSADGFADEAAIHSVLMNQGSRMPEQERSYFEERFGRDFSGVQIHTGERAEQTANALNARAFTYQNHIVMGKNEHKPGTTSGRKLMAHELTHTIQQTGGKSLKGHGKGATGTQSKTGGIVQREAKDKNASRGAGTKSTLPPELKAAGVNQKSGVAEKTGNYLLKAFGQGVVLTLLKLAEKLGLIKRVSSKPGGSKGKIQRQTVIGEAAAGTVIVYSIVKGSAASTLIGTTTTVTLQGGATATITFVGASSGAAASTAAAGTTTGAARLLGMLWVSIALIMSYAAILLFIKSDMQVREPTSEKIDVNPGIAPLPGENPEAFRTRRQSDGCKCCADRIFAHNIRDHETPVHVGHAFDLNVIHSYPPADGGMKKDCDLHGVYQKWNGDVGNKGSSIGVDIRQVQPGALADWDNHRYGCLMAFSTPIRYPKFRVSKAGGGRAGTGWINILGIFRLTSGGEAGSICREAEVRLWGFWRNRFHSDGRTKRMLTNNRPVFGAGPVPTSLPA